MRFLADMGVDLRIVQWLREQAHDVTHLREEGMHRAPNGEIFEKAVAEDRVVLTFDLDFGEIAALTKARKASIILFRLHNTRTSHVIARLAAVLPDCADALTKGAVVVVEEARHRVRFLPVGEAGDNP
jgi:predicted nuclease of predicted toxin-antitoxin system